MKCQQWRQNVKTFRRCPDSLVMSGHKSVRTHPYPAITVPFTKFMSTIASMPCTLALPLSLSLAPSLVSVHLGMCVYACVCACMHACVCVCGGGVCARGRAHWIPHTQGRRAPRIVWPIQVSYTSPHTTPPGSPAWYFLPCGPVKTPHLLEGGFQQQGL